MQYTIRSPKKLDTIINLPASKSISNRALVIHALSGGAIMPENLSDCDDTEVIIKALHDMPDIIDIKAAGTAMRFMTAYLSVTEGTHVITGTERMKHRPIGILVNALRYLGADVEYVGEEGFPPLRISGGQLQGGKLEIPGNVSSQYISALLMVGPVMKQGLELRLTGNIISRPYIDLTLCTMRDFGAEVEWTADDTVKVLPGCYKQRKYLIENDWSAASYWYEAVALCDDADAEVRLTGLHDGSLQGDSVVKYLFNMLGVKTVFEKDADGNVALVKLKKMPTHLPRLDYDFTNQPDMAQTFVTCCAAKGIPLKFTGLSTLKIKETDRIEALKTEMRKLGYVIKDNNGNELSWDGERCEPVADAAIDTYEDHRMAMSFAPLAFRHDGLKINDPQVVSKSYPHFWTDMAKAGFAVEGL